MTKLKIKLTNMAYGGSALGRDENNRVVFVTRAIPGETVEATLTKDDVKYAQGTVAEVIQPAAVRVEPRCAHFDDETCSHFQHINYETQLEIKREVILDQLKRIGGVDVLVHEVLASPKIWESQTEVVLSPTEDGGFGYWSAVQQKTVPATNCHLLDPTLQQLMQDFDIELPDLRKMTLRMGQYEDLLVALETDDIEPPSLEVDFPVSVTIVLPDQTTASLIGDLSVVQYIKGRDFQISAGCYFYPNPGATEQLIDAVLNYAAVDLDDIVLELFSGSGLFTAFIAEKAGDVMGVEINGDAIADAAVNLDEFNNVSLYEAYVVDALPMLSIKPTVIVADPPEEGLTPEIIRAIAYKRPERIVYVSHDVATLARDVKTFSNSGYQLLEVQPVDMQPHTYHTDCVALLVPQNA
jgi:23S rRNA (uracil1939-C5)-methyltransferase